MYPVPDSTTLTEVIGSLYLYTTDVEKGLMKGYSINKQGQDKVSIVEKKVYYRNYFI